MQRVRERLHFGVKTDDKTAFCRCFRVDMRREQAVDRKRRPQADRVAAQQRTRNVFDVFRVEDHAFMRFRPAVDCKNRTAVGRSRDDCRRAQPLCEPSGKLVRAAEMAGEQRDDKPSLLVDHNDRRVIRLSGEIGRGRADRDACRAHENDQVAVYHRLLCKPRERSVRERQIDRARVALTQKIRQQPGSFRGSLCTDFGKGDEFRVLHRLASRKPVVNAGSYSLERS